MTTEAPKKKIVVCICGLAGSGKSTLAKKLAKKYKLKYVSGGDALKRLAEEEGYHPTGRGWWESIEGITFLKERWEDPSFDRKVDKKLLELARKGNIILDSRTMPWLLEAGFKIWLDAPVEQRARRIARRDKITTQEALKALKQKEEKTKTIYKQLYGFKLGEDLNPFDLIVDTEKLTAKQVYQTLCTVIDNVLIKPHSEQRPRAAAGGNK